jgi:CRISPR-associated protein (TIGR03986 family)
MSDKQYKIRVKSTDGKPRDQKALNQLKSNQLNMAHLDIIPTDVVAEFIIAATTEKHIEEVLGKLSSVGLEEIANGDANTPDNPAQDAPRHDNRQQKGGGRNNSRQQRQQGHKNSKDKTPPSISKKPYGFVSLPPQFTTDSPVWHDGTSSAGKLSGEIRFQLETLTPLLVGWERQIINEAVDSWDVPYRSLDDAETKKFLEAAAEKLYPSPDDDDPQIRRKKEIKVKENRKKFIGGIKNPIVEVKGAGKSIETKSVLCPLRAPWGQRPVIIPGDSLKGLLRHELGALLGAPMERVAERSYSYRPNLKYPDKFKKPFLVPWLARVPANSVQELPLGPDPNGRKVRVPSKLEIYMYDFEYNKKKRKFDIKFETSGERNYKGGLGAGENLNSKTKIYSKIRFNDNIDIDTIAKQIVEVPDSAQQGYLATLRHLTDLDHGHFSERHPDVPNVVTGDAARNRILEAAEKDVFRPGDLIWVEWDTQKQCIVSFGWHYYYRWAYQDTVRRRDVHKKNSKRHGLFPLEEEQEQEADGAPKRLSAVRRLFGYTGEGEGSAGIGKDVYEQLMGRVSINSALEVVKDGENEGQRFLPPTFLKELGMPRPSAVEFYLKQPNYPNPEDRNDQAPLLTYGDAAGYDTPGELAGRKFYLDRPDAYKGEPWKDDSEANRANERSTLALEASRPERKFRFTLRFRDLDPHELAAIMAALCPEQFREVLGGDHPSGYCSKLGYARPLGWGSVRIEAKALLFLDLANGTPELKAEQDIPGWVQRHYQRTESQKEWLAVHRRNHPYAADYPRAEDKARNKNIHTFHTNLRAYHAEKRRYQKDKT